MEENIKTEEVQENVGENGKDIAANSQVEELENMSEPEAETTGTEESPTMQSAQEPDIEQSLTDTVQSVNLLDDDSGNGHNNLDKLMDVVMKITVELGKTTLTLKQVLELQKGSIVELDRYAGDNVDIYVNNRMIAQGEVVVVDDKFGVRIVELISPKKDDESQE